MHAVQRLEQELLALDPNGAERDAKHYELAHAVSGLDRLCGCSFHPIFLLPRHPNWTFKNPSIALDPHSNGYCCAVRYSSWPMSYGYTHSELVMVRLNTHFEPVDTKYVVPLDRPFVSREMGTCGPEDARLFRYADTWFASASFSDAPACLNQEGNIEYTCMGLLQLDDDFNWKTFNALPNYFKQNEKNWMPIQGSLAWIYNPSDMRRVEIDSNSRTVAYYDAGSTVDRLRFARGGSQVVSLDDGRMLAVVHETITNFPSAPDRVHGYHRVYLHRFVLYSPGARHVLAVSPPFHFMTRASVEFAAGLAYQNGKLVVSFGHHDLSSWVAELSLSDVESCLEPV